MPQAAQLQIVLDRIAAEISRGHRDARRAFVLDAASRYALDALARGRTLRRLEILDGEPARVIAAARARLAHDRLVRKVRPFDAPAPVRRWTLLAVWIGERRLRHAARAVVQHPYPLQLAMAAE